eukprot:16440130-Heterocapsa_arctica.AAC.1
MEMTQRPLLGRTTLHHRFLRRNFTKHRLTRLHFGRLVWLGGIRMIGKKQPNNNSEGRNMLGFEMMSNGRDKRRMKAAGDGSPKKTKPNKTCMQPGLRLTLPGKQLWTRKQP